MVCRELGYFGRVEEKKFFTFGHVPDTFAMDDVLCTGDETCLVNCTHTTSDNCGGGEAAGVICFL